MPKQPSSYDFQVETKKPENETTYKTVKFPKYQVMLTGMNGHIASWEFHRLNSAMDKYSDMVKVAERTDKISHVEVICIEDGVIFDEWNIPTV